MKKEHFEPLLVTLFFVVLYKLTATANFSYDSITYALTMERAQLFPFHPYHLLANAPAYFIYKLMIWADPSARVLFLQQWLNHIYGGIACGFLYWGLAKTHSKSTALLASLALGVCSSYWYESVDSGSYPIAMIATIALALVLAGHVSLGAVGLGVLHGVAISLHEMLVLVVPSVALLLLWNNSKTWPERWQDIGRYSVGIFACAVVPYIVGAIYTGNSTVSSFVAWVFGPAGPRPNMGVLENPFWSNDLVVNATMSWKTSIWAICPSFGQLSFAGVVFQLVVAVAVLACLFGSISYLKRRDFGAMRIAALWLWVVLMGAFQFFHSVGATRFRLLFMPALLMIGLALFGGRLANVKIARFVAAALIFCVAWANYANDLRAAARWENNPNLVRIQWLKTQLHAKDFFLFAGSGPNSITNVYVAYFLPVAARSVWGYYFANPHGDLSQLSNAVTGQMRTGGRFMVESALFSAPLQTQLETYGVAKPGALKQWFDRYNAKNTLELDKEYGVVELVERQPLTH